MKRLIVGLATIVVVSGGVGLAGLGLAGTAQAAPGPAPLSHFTWCPGHPDPNDHSPAGPVSLMQQAGWDLTVCHDYYYQNRHGLYTDIVEGDIPAPPLPPLWVP
jgi:hypothetical protein